MGQRLSTARSNWKKIKRTSAFHNSLVFLMFVAVAAVFWFFMVMNDSVQESVDMKIRISNVPDSVTFITDPPENVHIGVRDKGTKLLRVIFSNEPGIDIDFREYAQDGLFRLSSADFMGIVKQSLGQSAQIVNISVDSLRFEYTNKPGKRVPLRIVSDVEAQPGKVISAKPHSSVQTVLLYSTRVALDTVTSVSTMPIVRRNLEETTTEPVDIHPLEGVKIIPSKVDVTIPVEPLVKKTQLVPVQVVNIPVGQSVLLFPNKVEVSYYLPMSRFNDELRGFSVVADYNHLADDKTGRVRLHLAQYPAIAVNAHLRSESVEYTIVK